MVARREVVAAPQATPARFGLLSVAQMPTDTGRWEGGILTMPNACGNGGSYGDPCPAPGDREKADSAGVVIGGGDPFTVYAGFRCAPVGFTDDEIRERGDAALLAGEERTVEEVFWTGVTDNAVEIHPHLAENTASTPGVDDFTWLAATTVAGGGGAVSVRRALADLERELAGCYGGQGVIHMPRDVATVAVAEGIVERYGNRLETKVGTLVAAGAGYPGTSPTGAAAAAGESWVYATGAVQVRRSGVFYTGSIAESLDRVSNTIQRLAERTYVVTWDCCLLAARVGLEA